MRLNTSKVAIILANLCIALGIFFARVTPARHYEISIYQGTPNLTWLLFATATILSVWIAIQERSWIRWFGVITVNFLAITLLLLPIIRGYFGYGLGDSPTHLGWVKDILEGGVNPWELRYFIHHIETAIIHNITDISVHHALYITSISIILVLLTIAPLFGFILTREEDGAIITSLSACTLFPIINAGAGHVNPQPTAQAAFYLILPIYLFHRSMSQTNRYSILLIVTTVVLLFMHPHRIIHLLIYIGGVMIVVSYIGYNTGDYSHTKKSSIFFVFVTLIFWSRTLNALPRELTNNIFVLISSFTALFNPEASNRQGEASKPQGSTETIMDIIATLDISLFDLYLRIFLVPSIYATTTIIALGIWFQYRLKDKSSSLAQVITGTALQIPFFALAVSMGIFLPMRNLPQILVLGVITGAVGIYYIFYKTHIHHIPKSKTILTVIIVLFIFISAVSIFPSPYILKPNQQITESSYTGYETSFSYRGSNSYYSTLRIPASRYKHMIYGTEASRSINISGSKPQLPRQSFVPNNMANQDLSAEYPQGQFISIIELEAVYYKEILNYRHNMADFIYIETTQDADKVYDNNNLVVYNINGDINKNRT